MSAYRKYKEDLPEFIRGRLDRDFAHEIAQAAETDTELREAIEEERALDRILALYEVPEPAEGFERRFWERFHESRTIGEHSGGAGWLLKLAGPVAACVLIAIGVILFVKDDGQTPVNDTEKTAQTGPGDDAEDAPAVTWDESEFDYLAGDAVSADTTRDIDTATLEELKALDDARFSPLDNMERPEDLLVIDELDLLNEIAELETEAIGDD